MLNLDIERTAVYLRISLDTDGDEKAVERQQTQALMLARQRGWDVVETYTDNSLSASRREVVRPAYEKMLADYRAGRFDAIICYDLDRLTRQPRQLEDWIEEAEKNGLVILTLNGEADLSTDGGRMYARIKAAVARGEIERKGQRQKDANRQRAEKGAWQFSRRPFGFKREDGKIVQVPEEADAIRQAFAAYLSGKSYQSIAEGWTAQGLTTTLGHPWRTDHVMMLMRNPRLAGIVVYKGEEFPDAKPLWEPIIDRRTWADFFEVKRGRKQSGAPSAGKPKHLLSGFAVCGVCGNALYATFAQRPQRKDGSRQKYRVYDCTKNRCVSIAADPLDEFIEAVILTRLKDPKILRALRAAPNVAPVEAELAELRRNRANVADLVGEGLLTRSDARVKLTEMGDRIERLQARLSSMRQESPLTDLAMVRSVAPRWKKLGVVERRRVVADLGMKIRVSAGRRGVVFKDATGKRTINPERLDIDWLTDSKS